MLCPNCKSMLKDDTKTCQYCGIDIAKFNQALEKRIEDKKNNVNVNINNTKNERDVLSQEYDYISKINKQDERTDRAKRDANTKKAKHIIPFVIVGIILIASFLFIYWKRTIITWDIEYGDFKYSEVTDSILRYKVSINKGELKDVTFTSECGVVLFYEGEVMWNLKGVSGDCELVAHLNRAKSRKVVKVLPSEVPSTSAIYERYNGFEDLEDIDNDGINNSGEVELLTNKYMYDTDLDGISDYDEVNKYHTDPNNRDTDDDMLDDYNEILLNTDPNNFSSSGGSAKDGFKRRTFNINKENLMVTIEGMGNIASTKLNILTDNRLSAKPGLINKIYNISGDSGAEGSVTFMIDYSEFDLEKYSINEDNLGVFLYYPTYNGFDVIESTVNKVGKMITAEKVPYGYYVIGDTTKVDLIPKKNILFIIDNSWSLYDNSQYKEITNIDYKSGLYKYSELPGYDTSFNRINKVVDYSKKLLEYDYNIAIAEFRNDYKRVNDFTTDIDNITVAAESMKKKFNTNAEGRNISAALMEGLNEFENVEGEKYIVLITGGDDSTLQNSYKRIISTALNKGIRICSIGFEEGSSSKGLESISKNTFCNFYSTVKSDNLDFSLDKIIYEIKDGLLNFESGDALLVSSSDFMVTRDNLKMANYISTKYMNGHSYGIHSFIRDYYNGNIDLTNTYFNDRPLLYSYSFKTNALKYALGHNVFDEEIPIDFRKLENGKLNVNSNYKVKIEESGLYDISNIDYKKNNVGITSCESLLLNDDKLKSITRDEAWLIERFNNNDMTFDSTSGSIDFINALNNEFNDNKIVLLGFNTEEGFNVVNGVSVSVLVNNGNIYYIGVYDTNYLNEIRYLKVICNGDNMCKTMKNEYYNTEDEVVYIKYK